MKVYLIFQVERHEGSYLIKGFLDEAKAENAASILNASIPDGEDGDGKYWTWYEVKGTDIDEEIPWKST